MPIRQDILHLVERTPFIDTHTHLVEESDRLRAVANPNDPFPWDFAMLLLHYSDSDLLVSGFTHKGIEELLRRDLSPREKWRIVAPYYERARHTGYMMNVRETLRLLYGENDLREDNVEAVSAKLRDFIQPGFTQKVLRDVSNIRYAMVDPIETPFFRKTEMPDLYGVDINTRALSTALNVKAVCEQVGREANTLDDWYEIITWIFDTYGPSAVATKNQSAYERRLDYAFVSREDAAPLFARFAVDPASLSAAEVKALQDHLFHYCVDQATERGLPVKLHTGYYAGDGGMPMDRVRRNISDLCPIFQAHRKTRFVLMHIAYPCMDELIAVAKHYENVHADMCWAWIVNPMASVRFLKEYLMAAPASKLLTFGSDYTWVEKVCGHASIARRGIAQALSELVADGWIAEREIEPLAATIMNGNARRLFPNTPQD